MQELKRVKSKAGCEGCAYFSSWTEGECTYRSECYDDENEYIFITSEDCKNSSNEG